MTDQPVRLTNLRNMKSMFVVPKPRHEMPRSTTPASDLVEECDSLIASLKRRPIWSYEFSPETKRLRKCNDDKEEMQQRIDRLTQEILENASTTTARNKVPRRLKSLYGILKETSQNLATNLQKVLLDWATIMDRSGFVTLTVLITSPSDMESNVRADMARFVHQLTHGLNDLASVKELSCHTLLDYMNARVTCVEKEKKEEDETVVPFDEGNWNQMRIVLVTSCCAQRKLTINQLIDVKRALQMLNATAGIIVTHDDSFKIPLKYSSEIHKVYLQQDRSVQTDTKCSCEIHNVYSQQDRSVHIDTQCSNENIWTSPCSSEKHRYQGPVRERRRYSF